MEAAELDRKLGAARRVFLDSSACIAYHSTAEPSHPPARHLFQRIARPDDLTAYLSVVSAAELLIRPIRAGNADLSFMHTFLRNFPNLQVLPADFEVALQAATIRAQTGLALPDALLVSSALLTACEAVVTNDRRWHRRLQPLFPRFTWIALED